MHKRIIWMWYFVFSSFKTRKTVSLTITPCLYGLVQNNTDLILIKGGNAAFTVLETLCGYSQKCHPSWWLSKCYSVHSLKKKNVNSHSKKSVLLIPRFGKNIILSFPNRTKFFLNSQIQSTETIPRAFLKRKKNGNYLKWWICKWMWFTYPTICNAL